jgi:hypothetical protein
MGHQLDTSAFINPVQNKDHGGARYAPPAVRWVDSKVADVNQVVDQTSVGNGPNNNFFNHYQIVRIAQYLLECA